MNRKQSRVLSVILTIVVLSPFLWWVKWTRGQQVLRSRHDYYTVYIYKSPQRRYWLAPIGYWFDSGERLSTSVYEFTVYSSYQSAPLTSFTATDQAIDRWENTSIKWLKSRKGAGHFVVSFNGTDTFDCQFGHNASWRRL